MTRTRIACMTFVIAALFCAPLAASAEDAISHPAKKPIGPSKNEMVPSLAVLNAKGATLQGNKLLLAAIGACSFGRHDRQAGSNRRGKGSGLGKACSGPNVVVNCAASGRARGLAGLAQEQHEPNGGKRS